MKTDITRRSFLGMAALGSAAVGAGLAGCAPTPKAAAPSEELAETGAAATDWVGSAPEIAAEDIVETKETDLLIIGAGNAGMAAAATAADLGLDFMLCEKNNNVGMCRWWIGAVNTKFHREAGIEVDEAKLLNELTRYASNKCNPQVWKTWIRESSEMIEWLDGIMPGTLYLDTIGYDHHTGGTDFYVPPIQHMDATMAQDRDEAFQTHIEGLGHEISFGYNLQKLLREDGGAVTGAIFETESGMVQVNAKNTILATGGYADNPQMIRTLSPIVDRCVTQCSFEPGRDGYGIRAALWVGAVKDADGAPMIFDRGLVAPGVDAGYDGDGDDAAFPAPAGQFMLGSQPFMKVARTGKRFVNESTPYDFVCHAAATQPGGVWCQIMDSNAREDMARFSTVGCSKFCELFFDAETPIADIYKDYIDAGLVMTADTLDELADKLGFEGASKENFLAECERYNELYDKQVDEDFGKEAFRLSALRTPPFFGGWYGGSLLTTVDGVQINEDMQVLDANCDVIPGLYAAGDCSGSLFSGNYPEYIVGCACGRTITFGRHAVRHIAGDLA